MKAPVLYNLLNLRKPVSHIAFLVFSLLLTIIIALTGTNNAPKSFSFPVFIVATPELKS